MPWKLRVLIGLTSLIILAYLLTLPLTAETEKSLSPSSSVKKGNLSVLSDPGGAQVFLNDAPYGKTPLQLSLPVGTYQLRLEKAGYVTIKDEVQIKEGEDTALDFELEEKE